MKIRYEQDFHAWIVENANLLRAGQFDEIDVPSYQTFFEHLRALLQYIPFKSWEPVMRFMLEALDGKTIPDLTKET